MTDTQILTIAIALVAPIAAMLWNNSRISDNARNVDTRISELSRNVDTRIGELSRNVDTRISELRQDVAQRIDDKHAITMNAITNLTEMAKRIEDKLLDQLGDHESRIHKLETPK